MILLEEWWPAIVLAVSIVGFWLGSRFAGIGRIEAPVLAFAIPLVALGMLAAAMRSLPRRSRTVGLVMAGVALEQRRPDLHVRTAGTLTVNGMPISWRTRAALDAVGLPWPHHASKQAERAHVEEADVVIGLAPEHVHWVRREHPEIAHRTATLIRLVGTLPPPTSSASGLLGSRLDALGLATVELGDWEEVVDPGGGEVEGYLAAAHQIVGLVERLAVLL